MLEIVLDGCRPTPLAHYLKALGVLRLVAEQKDPLARGFWSRDRFVLCSNLERAELERFLLEEYEPTPVTGPWNGGSGYYDKDNTKAIDAITSSEAARYAPYRETIAAAKTVLARLSLTEKPNPTQKEELLRACRAAFPDTALKWLDATFVLSDDGAKYPPLLGTGGNDGRLEFTNNFMQRLGSLFDPGTGLPEPEALPLLRASLFEEATTDLAKGAPIGQFLPGSAGGVNVVTGFGADSLINSWDFVLMLEGATLFAAAAARCLEQDTAGVLSYPFTVRSVGVGYHSSTAHDETKARAEIWMPLWQRPISLRELLAVLSEGRARVGGRAARNGVDFARAVAGLGVDRGIESFQRFGFHERNGLSYFAVPIGRFQVHAEPRVECLHEIDAWLDQYRGKASAQTAPASAARALRQLETSILDLCLRGDAQRQQAVLCALGRCERAMATSSRWTEASYANPVPALSGQWLLDCDDGTAEYRLAAAVASVWGNYASEGAKPRIVSIRRQLEPVATWKHDSGLRVRWNWEGTSDIAWTEGHLVDCLNSVMRRRLTNAVQSGVHSFPDVGRVFAELGDVAAFIDGRIDEERMTDLLWGLVLLDWTRVKREHSPASPNGDDMSISALYALMKLCFPGTSIQRRPASRDDQIPLVPRIHRAAAAGDSSVAANESIRRLRGSGFAPAVRTLYESAERTRRTAAALLFPIGDRARRILSNIVLRPSEANDPATAASEGSSS